jgi:uncharacterized protein
MGIPGYWRTVGVRMRMDSDICSHCDTRIFPPRPICPNCKGEVYINSQISKGEVFSASTITSLPMEASSSSK